MWHEIIPAGDFVFPHEEREKKIRGGRVNWNAHRKPGRDQRMELTIQFFQDMIIVAYVSRMLFFLLSHWRNQMSQWNCLYKGYCNTRRGSLCMDDGYDLSDISFPLQAS